MKIYSKLAILCIVVLFAASGFTKDSDKDKPKDVIKDAVNSTAKLDNIYLRITLGKDKRFVWNGFIKDNKDMQFFGTGSLLDNKSTEKSEKMKVFYDGKNYVIEKKADVWETAKPDDISNLGAAYLRGTLLKTPFDLFTLIKKYSMDECEYAKDEKDADGEKKDDEKKDADDKKKSDKPYEVICKKDEKKAAKFIDYQTYWKELKKQEHWKDSLVSTTDVKTTFIIDSKSELLKQVKFEYNVEFMCNYGKGDKKCMGCISDIGDVITFEFLTEKDVKVEYPDSLKRKLGIKDTAEATGGLKLTLSVSKSRINKGDSLEFEVIWENVSKEDLKIARELRFNPFLLFSIDGEIDLNTPRYNDNSGDKEKDSDDNPLVLKPGKTYKEIFFMENDGRLVDDQTIRVLGLGQFLVKAKTKLHDSGTVVESNTVEVNIAP